MQALRGRPGRLCITDGRCRHSESLLGCNGACDHKGRFEPSNVAKVSMTNPRGGS